MGLGRSGPPATQRADPMGKGREGVNPSPGEGDLRGLVDLPQVLHARWPEASADFCHRWRGRALHAEVTLLIGAFHEHEVMNC